MHAHKALLDDDVTKLNVMLPIELKIDVIPDNHQPFYLAIVSVKMQQEHGLISLTVPHLGKLSGANSSGSERSSS